jgi:hypothetical protein
MEKKAPKLVKGTETKREKSMYQRQRDQVTLFDLLDWFPETLKLRHVLALNV